MLFIYLMVNFFGNIILKKKNLIKNVMVEKDMIILVVIPGVVFQLIQKEELFL